MSSYPCNYSEALKKKNTYWENKPVKKLNDKEFPKNSKIELLRKRKIYNSDTPIELKPLEWNSLDLNNDNEINKICDFLNKYYMIDQSKKFILEYTKEYLLWSIKNELLNLFLNDEIIGTVSYSVMKLNIFDKIEKFGCVNYLCVLPKFRQKNLGEKQLVNVLIDEAIRRLAKYHELNAGIFTTERFVPTPISSIRYFFRPLNYKKLFEHNFYSIPGDIEKIHERFNENVKPSSYYFKANKEDINKIYELYNEFMKKFNLFVKYSEEELQKLLFNSIVKCYVMKNKNNEIVDFVSFYQQNQLVSGTDKKIKNSDLFLYSCLTEDITLLISNTIRLVKRDTDSDLLNVSDVMMNSEFLLSNKIRSIEDSDENDYNKIYDYKFIKSDGKIHLNFFNWNCADLYTNQISWFAI